MRKVVVAAADACRDTLTRGGFRGECLMATFTYREGVDWEANHMRKATTAMREWFRRMEVPFRYQWVIELTARGRPHYHMLLWVPRGFRIPKPDDRGWWPHGMTRIEVARRAVGYLVKYASKGPVFRCAADGTSVQEVPIPPGARLFSVGGLDLGERLITHRAGLPRWLSDATTGRCSRIRGGWLDRETGEVLKSPYRIEWGRNPDGSSFVKIMKMAEAGEIA